MDHFSFVNSLIFFVIHNSSTKYRNLIEITKKDLYINFNASIRLIYDIDNLIVDALVGPHNCLMKRRILSRGDIVSRNYYISRGRVTHICVSELATLVQIKGFSSTQRQLLQPKLPYFKGIIGNIFPTNFN